MGIVHKAYKADPRTGDACREDETIEFSTPLPEFHLPYSDWQELLMDEAKRIEEVLHRNLPGGVYDRVLALMCMRNASMFGVSHSPTPPPAGKVSEGDQGDTHYTFRRGVMICKCMRCGEGTAVLCTTCANEIQDAPRGQRFDLYGPGDYPNSEVFRIFLETRENREGWFATAEFRRGADETGLEEITAWGGSTSQAFTALMALLHIGYRDVIDDD